MHINDLNLCKKLIILLFLYTKSFKIVINLKYLKLLFFDFHLDLNVNGFQYNLYKTNSINFNYLNY